MYIIVSPVINNLPMRPWIIAGISIMVLGGLIVYYHVRPLSAKVRINSALFTVEVAATESQKQLGLGNRDALGENHGMLFPYDHKEQYNFWMRGMRFPLDFIWIDKDHVVDLTEHVPPPVGTTSPIVVKPNTEVDKVLEVNAGTIQKHGIKIGDMVDFLDR